MPFFRKRLWNWKNMTFYKKLLILYCLLVTFLVGCFYTASYLTSRETLDMKTEDYLNHIGDLISLKIWRSIDELDTTIQSAMFDAYLTELLDNYNESRAEDRQTALNYIADKEHQLVSLNPYVESVDFYFYNGDVWISPHSRAIDDVFKSPYFYINNLNQKLEWVEFDKANNTINGSKIWMDSKRRATALIVVKINRKFLTDVLSEDNLTQSIHYELTNQKGVILSSSNPEALGSLRGKSDGRGYIEVERQVTVLHWNLFLQSPKVTFSAYVLDYGKNQILLTLLILALGFLTSLAMAMSISKPIHRLARRMRSVAAADLAMSKVPMMQNEIAFLETSYNHMVKRIDELIKNVYMETIYRREAELKALQAQIHPHFLFNALDLVNWKALMAGQSEISELVQSLSRLMEANMRIDEKTVSIAEEVAYIRDYFNIMSSKFGNRITLRESLDERAAGCRIPKLLLQPLVENAIKHGFKYIERGEISIRTVVSGERLLIRIEDNGSGMTEERLEEIRRSIAERMKRPYLESAGTQAAPSSDGVGLVNIAHRLRVLYGDAGSMLLKSAQGKGTSITIHLPFEGQEANVHV
ncbi:sensor histidine kinase [Cohnella laeviribosi]|uniref:sensor histidine kinase n=1 Tax=Cohnella laeviribosi TaxID=380174 RepID=UPI0003635EDF|nr:sensor histidine kinase [Cohnella laeviribosi]